ncbi:hypothetical protein SMF913_13645 [Streptomyces malaysiensis]|uniref:Secreted protein n=1 Tax=Streptomyces malaysiensis TaxID=92644 RepID=A0A2J7ZBG5_STRMQ|nr:hypothetical protein SMF913_13645 [Streptomyces malaysiensis]
MARTTAAGEPVPVPAAGAPRPRAARPPRQATGLRQRLAELRGPATTPRPLDARALAALAANPGCRRRALLDGAGVDKGALAQALGAPANFGQSQFAHQRGNSFEARVKTDGGADLVRLLHERLRDGTEPPGPGAVATPDLTAPGPQGRTARTALALREATEAGRWALLDHPMVSLDVAGSPAFLEPDAVVVHPDGSWTVVEIKSFPMVDGSADPAKVGAAARQSAVYALALERVASMIGEPPEGADDAAMTPSAAGPANTAGAAGAASPAGAAEAAGPAGAAGPVIPTDPAEAADPTAAGPAEAAGPVVPAPPADAAEAATRAEAADPAGATTPEGAATPAEATALAGTAKAAGPADAADPVIPAASAGPAPARGRVRHQVLLVCPKDFSNLPTAEMVDVRKQLAVTRRQLDRLTRIEEIAAALPEGTTFDLRLTDDGRTPTRPLEELTAAVDAVDAAYAPECLSACELAAHCRTRSRGAGLVEALGRGVRGELGGLTTVDAVLTAAMEHPADDAPTGDPAVDALRRAAALRAEALASRPEAVPCR